MTILAAAIGLLSLAAYVGGIYFVLHRHASQEDRS